jgi:hypothetical protein
VETVAIVLAIGVAIVIVVAAINYLRGSGGGGEAPAPAGTSGAAQSGFAFRPPASDFHVTSGEAHVYFDVPLPEGDPDPVLSQILLAEAVEVLREKRSHLPLEGVSTVYAHAKRGAATVEIGRLTLDGPGELPPPPAPGEHPFLAHHGPDIFEEFGAEPPPAPGLDVRAPTDELRPLSDEVQLTAVLEAGLRAQGIDPKAADLADVVRGLLRVANYTVTGAGDRFTATRQGLLHYVEIVEHTSGEHPELSEKAINEFMVRFGQAGAARGLLFTPKFGPFLVYDKERRESRVRFVTRERFQGFVNALAIG